jgi:hypothetical protein
MPPSTPPPTIPRRSPTTASSRCSSTLTTDNDVAESVRRCGDESIDVNNVGIVRGSESLPDGALEAAPAEMGTIADAIAPDRAVAYHRGQGDIVVLADSVSLCHAADNLIANTRIHTHPEPTSTCPSIAMGDGIVITVDDDGRGIDPTDLDHVFDRFYRAERSRRRPWWIGSRPRHRRRLGRVARRYGGDRAPLTNRRCPPSPSPSPATRTPGPAAVPAGELH